jgi:hypothetical protein
MYYLITARSMGVTVGVLHVGGSRFRRILDKLIAFPGCGADKKSTVSVVWCMHIPVYGEPAAFGILSS